ncbi:MAG: sigma-54-dependent Fis family transcriptional regulator, partial [Planctomycetes bacterium]|nr:sigma-54-dependent Fis family transcriptional regulator [Planctomycetota bacterium]
TQSARSEGPFLAVNCAAIPSEIMESELFGHTKGAFTGAVRDKSGLFERAHGGTVLLDEIGDLDLRLQTKLLRFLEDRRVRRVGSGEDREVDVRIVAATHRDLGRRIQQGAFREDLYYRIRVFQIDLPSLADRREDIPLLLDHFVRHFGEETGRSISGVSNSGLRALMAHHWPGNIRELRNAVEHAFVIADGDLLRPQDFPPEIQGGGSATDPVAKSDDDGLAEEVIRAVEESDGNRAEAARRLGISRVALWKRIRKLELDDRLPPARSGRRPKE